jgi:hypothetical protein
VKSIANFNAESAFNKVFQQNLQQFLKSRTVGACFGEGGHTKSADEQHGFRHLGNPGLGSGIFSSLVSLETKYLERAQIIILKVLS